jgi:hypothetical protein
LPPAAADAIMTAVAETQIVRPLNDPFRRKYAMGPTHFAASVLLVGVVSGFSVQCAPRSADEELSPRIGPPVLERYNAVRDGKDWQNPFLQVCADGVHVTVRALGREPRVVAISALRGALLDLPVDGWPYGRIVALQECSIGIPGDQAASRQRLAEVEAVLRTLGVQVSHWPA